MIILMTSDLEHNRIFTSYQMFGEIDRGILAIRYEPQDHKKKKGGGHSWQVWWSDKSVTWHPETDLTGIDHCHIRDAVIQPGKRIKLSGSRREDLLADELFPGQFFRRD